MPNVSEVILHAERRRRVSLRVSAREARSIVLSNALPDVGGSP